MTGTCQVYACHIVQLAAFESASAARPISGLPGLPSAPGRSRPGLSADPLGFGDRKATNSRLGPAKVPQPGVDLIYMAAAA